MPNVISCIFGWNEFDRAAAGLLGAGQRLAKDLNGKHCVLLVGTVTAPLLDELAYLSDTVHISDHPLLAKYHSETTLAGLVQACVRFSLTRYCWATIPTARNWPRVWRIGWAAARLDDLVNLPASRIAALLLVLASVLRNDASAADAWRTVRRDAARHRSPNAGYPEAAMAGALGLSLAGPRFYAGIRIEDAFMGDGRREAEAKDIRRALALYRCADAILLAFLAALAAMLIALD